MCARVCERLRLECRQAGTEAELQMVFDSQLPEYDLRHVDYCLSTDSDLCMQPGELALALTTKINLLKTCRSPRHRWR